MGGCPETWVTTAKERIPRQMAEQKSDRVHPESVVLDIGQDIGALIIYTDAELRGREIEVSPLGSAATRVHVEVLERRVNGRQVFAAVFPKLRAGGYEIWGNSRNPSGTASIVGGEVTTVDWRW
jgi:hypothetical protein